MSKVATPTSVATWLFPMRVALSNNACTAEAPASPNNICICGKSSALTVSVPTKRSRTPIAMIRMGATEGRKSFDRQSAAVPARPYRSILSIFEPSNDRSPIRPFCPNTKPTTGFFRVSVS